VSEQPSESPGRSPRRRLLLAGLLGAAAMALAVPISGVFASDGSSSGRSQPSAVQIQNGGQTAPAPRRHNCPHHNGGQGGGGSSSSDTALQQF
jgi:hypothetical protein